MKGTIVTMLCGVAVGVVYGALVRLDGAPGWASTATALLAFQIFYNAHCGKAGKP